MSVPDSLYEFAQVAVEFPDLWLHVLDRVERENASGVDANGAPVEAWAVVYSGLIATVIPGQPEDVREWEQRGIQATHKIYIPRQPSGLFPQMGVRDRVVFGVSTLGGPAYYAVSWVENEMKADILLTVSALERPPG